MDPDPRYPVPDRSNFAPNKFIDDKNLPEGDLGASEGLLPDGRPYRLEGWYSEGATFVTIFFSTLDLEEAPAPALLELISGLVAEAEVPERYRRLNQSDVHTLEDGSGNIMYSLTFVVGEPEF